MGLRRANTALAIAGLLCATSLTATPPPPPDATPETAPPASWPEPAKAPKGAPNVLIVLTDDVGFGSTSTFGGPVPTPAFDSVARRGLRYNRFHTTAICSPTRASLLTGRNPQAIGMGYVANWAAGYEGYNSQIPKSAGTLPQILRASGYATAMFGKSHVTPEWEQTPAGPFDRWPTGLGFDYFYGFLGADTSAFEPALMENTRPVARPPAADYHLERDLADRALGWIAEHRATAPDRPFFLYYAPAAAHAPNHAPAEWLARFKGKFDQGWDVLRMQIFAREKALGVIPRNTADAPRPANLPRWDSLPAEKRQLYARYMEAYAAQLAYADEQIGRVIAAAGDDTLVIYIQGDNGASAEGSFDGKLYEQSPLAGVTENVHWAQAHAGVIGGPKAYSLIPGGWGWAMNAPFPWAKRYGSHFGGTRNAMALAWPGHVPDPGGLRSQFLHVSDVMPTILEAAGIALPEQLDGVTQQPVTGVSFSYTLAGKTTPSRRTSQIFAMAENLAIYRDGWVAATVPKVTPWEASPPKPVPLAGRQWQLFDVDRDFSQAKDLAAQHPERLNALVGQFWEQARQENILPIFTSEGRQQGRPDPNRDRREFVYTTPLGQIGEAAAPAIVGRSFRIEAEIETGERTSGVLVAHGGRFSGYSLHLEAGRPVFTFNLTPAYLTRITATKAIPPGAHRLLLTVALDQEKPGSPAQAILSVDGEEYATGPIPRTFARVVSHTEGFDVGQDLVSPVDEAYASETSRFGGKLNRLVVTLAD